MLDDADSFALDTDDALAQAVLGETQGESDLAPYCTPSYVEMEAGASWLKLNAAKPAIAIFEASRAQWSAIEQARDQALCLARLATAYAAAGEPELACVTAGELASVASDLTSARVTEQIASLRTALAPWRKDGDGADLLYRLEAFRLN